MVYLILTLLSLYMLKPGYALQRFYMEENCGGTIFMEGNIPAGRLAVTRRSKYRSTFSCDVTIIAPEQRRLVIVFREMDIEMEALCDDDFVQFFDGPTRSSPIVPGLKTRLCGHMPPIGNYVTSRNTLTVYFQSDVYRQQNGFEIVFTAFHKEAACNPDEFRCNNGRCIAKSLECDDFNNCGDHSDECKIDNEVLVAIILSVFLITIIATGVFLLIRKKKKKSKIRKVKQIMAEALRLHSGVGSEVYNKHYTATCTCQKLKPTTRTESGPKVDRESKDRGNETADLKPTSMETNGQEQQTEDTSSNKVMEQDSAKGWIKDMGRDKQQPWARRTM